MDPERWQIDRMLDAALALRDEGAQRFWRSRRGRRALGRSRVIAGARQRREQIPGNAGSAGSHCDDGHFVGSDDEAPTRTAGPPVTKQPRKPREHPGFQVSCSGRTSNGCSRARRNGGGVSRRRARNGSRIAPPRFCVGRSSVTRIESGFCVRSPGGIAGSHPHVVYILFGTSSRGHADHRDGAGAGVDVERSSAAGGGRSAYRRRRCHPPTDRGLGRRRGRRDSAPRYQTIELLRRFARRRKNR